MKRAQESVHVTDTRSKPVPVEVMIGKLDIDGKQIYTPDDDGDILIFLPQRFLKIMTPLFFRVFQTIQSQ